MIISARAINRPRTAQPCSSCDGWIAKTEPRLRLFGAAHHGDPPYAIYACIPCAEKGLRTGRDGEKVNRALAAIEDRS